MNIITLIAVAFVYVPVAFLLGALLKLIKVPLPTLVSLVALLGLGCLFSYQLNKPILKKVEEFARLDVPLNSEFTIPDTMAVYSGQYARHGDACNALCQRLLYNQAAKKVLVITDPKTVLNNQMNNTVVSYVIEQGNNCTNKYVISKRWGKIAVANVESRIAAGDCLVKKVSPLSDADVIFFHGKITHNSKYQDFKSLERQVYFVNYIELLKNKDNSFQRIYRFSEISAQPFAYPLVVGPIFAASGGRPTSGFYHTRLAINNPGPSYGNPIQEFKLQMEEIFGKALKPIEPAKIDTKQLVKDALESEAESNTAGLDMIGNHLGDLYLNRKMPTDDDMKLVIEALKDDRTSEWFHLSNFTWLWGDKRGSVPQEFAQELANRILRRKNIEEAARAIRFLPDGDAASIYTQLEQIVQDNILRERAYGAVIRLGDGGTRAIPYYIQILNEYEEAWNDTGYNSRRDKLRELGDAPIASVIGLCRLGKEALPSKSALFQLVENVGYKGSLGGSAIDALIEMGATQELEQKYKSDDAFSKEIQRAIGKRERAINKKGRSFCGGRIV